MAKQRTHLLIIDPQNDFCDIPLRYLHRDPASRQIIKPMLPVKGAHRDMVRLAGLVDRVGVDIDRIMVTLDTHRKIDIAHPRYWRDKDGNSPLPFTIITSGDIEAGIWIPRNPRWYKKALAYTRTLELSGQYLLLIWTEHCILGTWGHNVHFALNAALQRWSDLKATPIEYVMKGLNPHTENFGALMAAVPDPSDPSTQLNTKIIKWCKEAGKIGAAGEASSHCTLITLNQIADNIGEEHLGKFEILTDCMSPVAAVPGGPDFPTLALQGINSLVARGMKRTTAKDFLA